MNSVEATRQRLAYAVKQGFDLETKYAPDQPRGDEGTPQGGQFVPLNDSKAKGDTKAENLFLRMRWLSPAQQQAFMAQLSDEEAKGLIAYLYDGGQSDPRVNGARDVATRFARGKGWDVDAIRKSKAPKAPKGKSGGGKSGSGGGGKSGGGSKGKSSGGGKSSSGSSGSKKGSSSSSGGGSSSSKKKTSSSSSSSGTSTAKPKPPTAPGPPTRRVADAPGERATPGVPRR